jgi:hypothetical protein
MPTIDRATWCPTPARTPACSSAVVVAAKNAIERRAPAVCTLLTSTTAALPASAASSPAPVTRSTPVARASTET